MLLTLFLACAASHPAASSADPDYQPAPLPVPDSNQAVAVFAGGCFWCMESDFDKLPGVVATTSGFAGGHVPNPTYEQVCTETTGHAEAVRVVYDTTKLSYEQVLDWYWHHVDPTDPGGQFCDRGDSYRTSIFPLDETQQKAAEASKSEIQGKLGKLIVTPIVPGQTFYAAENYHQDFHDKNPARYQPYRLGCGRDARVHELWGE